MAENVVEPGPPSAKRPKLSSPAPLGVRQRWHRLVSGLPAFHSSLRLFCSLHLHSRVLLCISSHFPGRCLILKVFEWTGRRRPVAQPFSLPSDTFIATLCHVRSLCVPELRGWKWELRGPLLLAPCNLIWEMPVQSCVRAFMHFYYFCYW
uniref:Uncharacterized protein n=1 Tax=Mus musculus TaxID=10090 RepID=Q3USJ1_MOUSE|nr:unnamed protein product [Mus musculus]